MKRLFFIFIFVFCLQISFAQTSPSYSQITDKALTQALISGIGTNTVTLLYQKSITLSESVTIPNNITLRVDGRGKITIPTGLTLTINSRIEAGHQQIFFGGGAVTCTPRTNSSSVTSRYSGEVKPAWWGAKNDGLLPSAGATPGTAPLGTDSSVAFKAAAKFMATAGNQYSLFSNSTRGGIKFVLEPGAVYRVTGDNVFGFPSEYTAHASPATSRSPVDWNIDGNNAAFIWTPTLATDSFFGNADQMETMNFKDFDIVGSGFTGKKGIIISSKVRQILGVPGAWSSGQHHGLWENVRIHHTKAAVNASSTFDTVFYNTGYGVNDRYTIRNCLFEDVRVLYNENPEAVLPEFVSCTISNSAGNDSALTLFEIPDLFSGFSMRHCSVELKGKESTLLLLNNNKATREGEYDDGIGTADYAATFRIEDCRFEGPSDSASKYTIVDADYGTTIIDGIELFSNAVTAPVANGCYFAKTASSALVIFNNSKIFGKLRVVPTDLGLSNNYPYSIIMDNCRFSSVDQRSMIEYHFPSTGVSYSDKALAYKTEDAGEVINLGGILNRNPLSCVNGTEAFSQPRACIAPGAMPTSEVTVRYGTKRVSSNGYLYASIDDAPFLRLPPNVIITSAKAIVPSTSATKIRMSFKEPDGSNLAASASFIINISGTANDDFFTSTTTSGVYVPHGDVPSRAYFDYYDPSDSTWKFNLAPAIIELKYRGIESLVDIPVGIATATTLPY